MFAVEEIGDTYQVERLGNGTTVNASDEVLSRVAAPVPLGSDERAYDCAALAASHRRHIERADASDEVLSRGSDAQTLTQRCAALATAHQRHLKLEQADHALRVAENTRRLYYGNTALDDDEEQYLSSEVVERLTAMLDTCTDDVQRVHQHLLLLDILPLISHLGGANTPLSIGTIGDEAERAVLLDFLRSMDLPS